jgi:hypothetical protein
MLADHCSVVHNRVYVHTRYRREHVHHPQRSFEPLSLNQKKIYSINKHPLGTIMTMDRITKWIPSRHPFTFKQTLELVLPLFNLSNFFLLDSRSKLSSLGLYLCFVDRIWGDGGLFPLSLGSFLVSHRLTGSIGHPELLLQSHVQYKALNRRRT